MRQLVAFALLLLTSAAYGQHVQKAVVYFDHAQASLSLSDQKMLRALLMKAGASKVASNRLGEDRLGTENIDEIIISGHTDADGSSSYNQQLSQARAERVYWYFTSIFNDTTKLSTFYYGKTKPIAPNGTAFDKRLNRRVEVVIKYATSQAAATTVWGRPLAIRADSGNSRVPRRLGHYVAYPTKAFSSLPAYLCP